MIEPATDAVQLTFAEIAHLLSGHDVALRRLQVDVNEMNDGIRAAGLASLFARGLLEAESASVDRSVDSLAAVVRTSSRWAEMGLARDDVAGGFQWFEQSEARVQATAQPWGTFVLASVSRAEPFEEGLARFAAEFLAVESLAGAVFLKVAAADERDDGRALAARRHADDALYVSVGDTGSDPVERISEDELVPRIRSFITDELVRKRS